MAFVRTKIVKGRVYRSLEERYRQNGKVKSRYIRSLNDGEIDRSIHGYASELQDIAQGAAQLEARDKAAAEKSAGAAPAAGSGQENAASDKEGGAESGAA